MVREQRFDLGTQGRVSAARLFDEGWARGCRQVDRADENSLGARVKVVAHAGSSFVSSRRSQARTIVHSLSTVRFETPSTCATSSTVIPPKNLNSTIAACRS